MSRPTLRPRGDFAQDTLTAEFTTGQIVIMACVALGVAGLMFALGVIVGHYDPSRPAVEAEAESAPAESMGPAPEAPAVVTAAKETPSTPTVVSTPPPAVADPPAAPPETPVVTPSTEEPAAEETPATTQTASLRESVKPRITRVEPLPGIVGGGTSNSGTDTAPPLPEPAKVDPPAEAEKTETAKTPVITPSDSTKPVTVAGMDDDEPALMETMLEPMKVANAEPKPSEASPAPVAAELPKGPMPGKYGIQVASFTKVDGPKRAEEYAARVRSAQKLDARVADSKDGKSYTVVVVGYNDKAAADKACKEIRQLVGFKDSWVRTL